jgi:hypothetical protein
MLTFVRRVISWRETGVLGVWVGGWWRWGWNKEDRRPKRTRASPKTCSNLRNLRNLLNLLNLLTAGAYCTFGYPRLNHGRTSSRAQLHGTHDIATKPPDGALASDSVC